jgi:hypothetical protein
MELVVQAASVDFLATQGIVEYLDLVVLAAPQAQAHQAILDIVE